MLIERLEFIGFGNLTGQRIDFARNKLSVVVQPNEYGKSTMSEAIWAVLYDYANWDPSSGEVKPGTERKPLSGAAFKACLDIELNNRRMHLIRNFAERSLKVLDLSKDPSKADSDITSEFASVIASEQFGTSVTGLSRDLFRSTCFIGQRQLDKSPFARDRVLSSLLLSIADTGGAATNVYDAIGAIEERLAHFPFAGKQYPIEELLELLEDERQQLADSLKRLESARQNCDRDVERLSEVEERLSSRVKVVSADEYFQLCLEAADIDTRIARTQERVMRVREMESELQALSRYETFDLGNEKQIEEMWLRRQSRIADLKRLQSELSEKKVQDEMRNLEYRERGEEFNSFSMDDGHMVSSLAHTLSQQSAELDDTRMRYELELKRVRELGVNVDVLTNIRASLLHLEQKELDELHHMHAMVVAARERAAECLMSADRAHHSVMEITQGRHLLYKTMQRLFWPTLITAILMLLPLVDLLVMEHRTLSDNLVDLVILVYIACCGAAAVSWVVSERIKRSYRVAEETQARGDVHKYEVAAEELVGRISHLEDRIESFARKAKLQSGAELIRNMQEYALSAAQFKQLDFLEQLVRNNQSNVAKLKIELKPYFQQAQRISMEITPSSAVKLADDIKQFLEMSRNMGFSGEFLDHRASEIRFLGDELRDADRQFEDEFARLGLLFEDVEDGYAKYCQALANCRRREQVISELERLTYDSTSEMVLSRLESKRADIWGRMQQLIEMNPEIMSMTPPSSESVATSFGKEMSDLRLSVEELKRERDDLTVQIRAAMKNYQDNYLNTLENLETIERRLERVKNIRAALKLARDTFLRLAEENHAVWADKLNDIAREQLKHLGTEYESLEFDADLSISVRRKGQREPFNEWQIANQLSAGTREQLHWLARMAVVQFLCPAQPLPIILDEPFSEFDDERFLKIMRFLLKTISKQHQVIIFSCHQKRHEWLMEQLDAEEREAMEICRLAPLKSDAGAFARR